jgi:hypothetical protein
MKIKTVIDSIVTYLEAMSWGAVSTPTKFNAVFTYNNWVHDEGYPFAIVNDQSQVGESLTNRHITADTTIRISVCVHFGIIDKATEDERLEEATLRVREASDALKEKLNTYTFMNAIGADFVTDWSYGDIELENDLGVVKRDFLLNIKEILER